MCCSQHTKHILTHGFGKAANNLHWFSWFIQHKNCACSRLVKSSFGLALPEVWIPLKALRYEVMEAVGEGPKIRVQG